MDVDRMWDRIDATGPCWLWLGHTSKGYGHIHDGTRDVPVHRVVYELLVGPIPDGLELDHLCRVRRCCNPDHVEVVTCAENLARSPLHPAGKTHCRHGHAFSPENTYVRPNGRRKCRECHRIQKRRYRSAQYESAERNQSTN